MKSVSAVEGSMGAGEGGSWGGDEEGLDCRGWGERGEWRGRGRPVGRRR